MVKVGQYYFNFTIEELISNLNQTTKYFQYTKNISGELLVSCPFHKDGKEKHPSCEINLETGQFYCFSCKSSGSLYKLLDFVLEDEDVIEYLKSRYDYSRTDDDFEIHLDFGEDKKEKPIYQNPKILDLYKNQCDYLIKRGISQKIIDYFDIGYDKDTNSITFPIKDYKGNILFFARRNIEKKVFNYPKDAKMPLYGVYEYYKLEDRPKDLYICESMIDALTLWSWRKPAIALNGLGNKEQLQELNKIDCQNYILATDNDYSGKQARLKINNAIKNKMVYQLDYNGYLNYKDINEMSEDVFNKIEIKSMLF